MERKNKNNFTIVLIVISVILLFVLLGLIINAIGWGYQPVGIVDFSKDTLLIQLPDSEYDYTGMAVKPDVLVKYNKKIISFDEYTISYNDNVNIGTATVIVKCDKINKTATANFKIVPTRVSVVSDFISKSDSITISWDEVNSADYYYVTCENQNDKNDEIVKTNVKNTSYTQSGLEPSTKYNYNVRAVKVVNGIEYISKQSDNIQTTTCPDTVKNVSIKLSEEGMIGLSWDELDNCDGYEVFSSNYPDEFSIIATVTDSKYQTDNLSNNTLYKVRGFITLGEKKYYGDFSESVSLSNENSNEDNTEESIQKVTNKTGVKNLEVRNILQESSGLPTGCEVTSLAMLLNYHNYKVDAFLLATQFLPKSDVVEDNNGARHGPNFITTFAGDPTKKYNSYGCYAPCITTTANSYLTSVGSKLQAYDTTGMAFDELLTNYIDSNIPVLIWVTSNNLMTPYNGDTWINDQTGETVQWIAGEHCVVLTGYNKPENTIYVSDPLVGNTYYDYDRIKTIYNNMGLNSMVIK